MTRAVDIFGGKEQVLASIVNAVKSYFTRVREKPSELGESACLIRPQIVDEILELKPGEDLPHDLTTGDLLTILTQLGVNLDLLIAPVRPLTKDEIRHWQEIRRTSGFALVASARGRRKSEGLSEVSDRESLGLFLRIRALSEILLNPANADLAVPA